MKFLKNYWLFKINLHAYYLKYGYVVYVPSSWSAIERNKQLPSPFVSFIFILNTSNYLFILSKYWMYYFVSLKISPFYLFIFLRIFFNIYRYCLRYSRFFYISSFLSFLFLGIWRDSVLNIINLLLILEIVNIN